MKSFKPLGAMLIFTISIATSAALAQALVDPCQYASAVQQVQQLSLLESAAARSLDVTDDTLVSGLGLSIERRLKVICEMKNAVMDRYALIDLKRERLNIDVEATLQGCARAELAIDSTDRQAFLDRVQLCIAKLHDTHFGGYPRTPRPAVVTAILTINIGDKIYITQNSPLLIAKIKAGDADGVFADLDKTLAPGNEITKIEGIAAIDAVKTLVPYINASSPAFALNFAAREYFMRTFSYPTKRTVNLEIKTASGDVKHIALPWLAQATKGHLDALTNFNKIGIPQVNELQWTYNKDLRKYEKDDSVLWTVGYNASNPLFKSQGNLVTYNDDSGSPGLRIGEVVIDRDHVFCYMQLLTFMSVKLTPNGSKDGVPFLEPIQKFVASCESKKLPLILDLKRNGGGIGSYPPKLLAILSQKDARYPGSLAAFRATPNMVDMVTQDLNPTDSGARFLDGGVDEQTLIEAMADAVKAKAPYADIVNFQDVTADDKVGGYSQKIVAIVTPFCISACDMTARILKNSGRAVLVGTQANGTGAGFWSSDSSDSKFDDTEGQLEFEVPNFLFGMETQANQPERLPFAQNKGLLMENEPTMADVVQDYDPADFSSGQGQHLAAAAVKALFN